MLRRASRYVADARERLARRGRGRLAVAALAALAVGLALSRTSCARHQSSLAELRVALRAVPLPRGAERVEAFEQIGILQGNGNHCDYVVAVRVRTSRSPAEFARHFEGRSIRANFDGAEAVVPLSTWVGGEDESAAELLPAAWLRREPRGRPDFVVYAAWFGQEPGHDWRCH